MRSAISWFDSPAMQCSAIRSRSRSETDLSSLAGAASVADLYANAHAGDYIPSWEEEIDDGSTVHAEVGTYRANACGLHEVIGNVWELCRDPCFGYDSRRPFHPGDSERPSPDRTSDVIRGGGFEDPAARPRSAMRFAITTGFKNAGIGCRPARAVATR